MKGHFIFSPVKQITTPAMELPSISEWRLISDKLFKATFNSKFVKMTAIVCYAPTEDAEDEIKDEICKQLEEAIWTSMIYCWWLVTLPGFEWITLVRKEQ